MPGGSGEADSEESEINIPGKRRRQLYVGLIGRCPCCGDILEEDTVYCDCGQRLDWWDEE